MKIKLADRQKAVLTLVGLVWLLYFIVLLAGCNSASNKVKKEPGTLEVVFKDLSAHSNGKGAIIAGRTTPNHCTSVLIELDKNLTKEAMMHTIAHELAHAHMGGNNLFTREWTESYQEFCAESLAVIIADVVDDATEATDYGMQYCRNHGYKLSKDEMDAGFLYIKYVMTDKVLIKALRAAHVDIYTQFIQKYG